jgi:hypothetical protein
MEIYKQKLTEYKKRNGQPLTQKSQDQYFRTIKGLVDKNGYDWRIDKLKEHLNSFETPTQLAYINAIINYLTIMGYTEKQISPYKKYKEELEKLKESKPIVNPKKENNLADWNEILQWRDTITQDNDKYKNWSYSGVMLELILHLYTTFPRRNEIAELKWYTDEDCPPDNSTDNYILTDNKTGTLKIVFSDYKTQGTYGTQEYPITEENNGRLYKLINVFLELNDFRTHFFHSPRDINKPLTRLNLTKMLQRSSKKHIGKSVSTDRIRKAYAGQNKEAIAQIENTAEMLSHSVGTNMKHYNVKK